MTGSDIEHGALEQIVGRRPRSMRWREIEEWARTSYTLVAPRQLARQVLETDQPGQ